MHSKSWASVIFSHQCEIGIFDTTTTRVVFMDGGYCLTPSGQIHLASGSRRPLLDRLLHRSDSAETTIIGSFYSQNGKYLFISEAHRGNDRTFRAIRSTPFTQTPDHLCSWKDSSRRLVDLSPSGRFLVLSPMASKRRGEEFLYLYDVDINETIQLPFVQVLEYSEAKFQFARDEMELIAFIPCWNHSIDTINVFVWTDLQSGPALRSHGQSKLENFLESRGIHINEDEISALMVSDNRVIQRVEFHTQVTFSQAPSVDDDYPFSISQVSTDGNRWAMLRYGQNRAQFQMTEISTAKGPIHKLGLEFFPCEGLQQFPAVSLSPDLTMLVVDAQVYSIAEGLSGLTSASLTIEGLPELLARHRTEGSLIDGIDIQISSCNSYVVFMIEGDPYTKEVFPYIFYAFRIDLVSKSSTRLDLQLPKGLTFISASFHPSQQLMLLKYSSSSNSDAKPIGEFFPLRIYIWDLESLEMKPIFMERFEG